MNETMNQSRQSSEEQQITIPFEAILGAIVKFWYIILILAVVFGGEGYVRISSFAPEDDIFEAERRMLGRSYD